MKLWTLTHVYQLLPTLAVCAILAVVIGVLLKNKDEKIRMIPIQIISVILILLEIAKQIYCICTGYDYYRIPLHYCALFIYLLPLFSFYKGKGKDFVRGVTVACCSALMLFLLVYPELIYGEGSILSFGTNFLSAHTVLFHNLVPFAFFLILSLNLYKPQTKKDIISSLIFFSCYSVIAGIMANVLKTNFNNFYECNIGPIGAAQAQLVANIGTWGQVIYVVAVGIVTVLFSILSYLLYRGLAALYYFIKRKCKRQKETTPATTEEVK